MTPPTAPEAHEPPLPDHPTTAAGAGAGTGTGTGTVDAVAQVQVQDEAAMERLHRNTTTTTEEIDSTITKPGSVKINVKGAFIVDPDTSTPRHQSSGSGNGNGNGRGSPTHHETSDIRLPNHTAVVSHIAVDVRTLFSFLSCAMCPGAPFLASPHMLTSRKTDWRLAHQARLLLARSRLD